MTSQQDQIQSLIADIEQILSAKQPKTTWIKASDTEPQREALAKVQEYLRSLQSAFDAPGGWGPVDPTTGEMAAGPRPTSEQGAGSGPELPSFGKTLPSEESAENVLQALLTEMKFLKSSALEPLRLEMDELRQERDGLQAEVKALAKVREQAKDTADADALAAQQTDIDEQQLNQFLSALMERLQERLNAQVSQTLNQLEADHAAAIAQLGASANEELLQLQPSGQLEELRQLQARSDQLLVNIDATLQGMFETLQKNIDSYQISLNEGIENMHSLGRQGEVIVRSLVDDLTQQLGQTTPPEPAFFPTRSAEAALAGSAEVIEADADSTGIETVTSLQEVIPEGTTAADFAATSIEDDLAATSEAPESEPAVSEEKSIDSTDQTASDWVAPAAFVAPESEASAALPTDITVETDEALERETDNFIKEDGTIDIERLQLDIDRSEEDSPLTADELMIDAAEADAVVAANEAEDPEIEAKVIPTAEAAYLAELTLGDLTIDPDEGAGTEETETEDFETAASTEASPQDIEPRAVQTASQDEGTFTESEASEEILVGSMVEPVDADSSDDAVADSEQSAGEQSAGEQSAGEQSVGEQNSETGTAQPEMVELPDIADVASADVAELELPSTAAIADDLSDIADLPDLEIIEDDFDISLETDAPLEETATTSAEDAETTEGDREVTASASDEDPLIDFEEPPVDDFETFPIDDDFPLETATTQDSDVASASDRGDTAPPTDTIAPTESAVEASEAPDLADLLPDLGGDQSAESAMADFSDDGPVEDRPDTAKVPDIPEPEPGDSETDFASPMALDTPLPEDVVADLAANSDAANRSAMRTSGRSPDATTADLEEPVVSEEQPPNPEMLGLIASPLDSALIPDSPDADTPNLEADDPFDAAFSDIEESDAEQTTEATDSSVETTSPPDFDDDLDFFQTAPTAPTEPSASEADSTASVSAPFIVPPSPEPGVEPAAEPAVETAEATEPTVPASEEATPMPPIETELDRPAGDEGDDDPTGGKPADWFLGIDLGTTGLSAVLINQRGEQVYPLCWNIAEDEEANRFRLPVVVGVTPGGKLSSVGPAALQSGNTYIRNIKGLLKTGIPHGQTEDPKVQWSDQTAIPLGRLQAALVELLKTLSAQHLGAQAVGLSQNALQQALADLQGVVVGYPTNWPDTYSFNIREAVLASGIVSNPERVFFVEEAIAAVLSALPDPLVADEPLDNQQPGLYNCKWSGGTVVISAGATLTEAAVANLPTELDQLSYSDFSLRSYTYAGDALDQDIVCQLMHLPVQAQIEANAQAGEPTAAGDWESLGLGKLKLPQPGEADRINRHRLRQRLNASELGRQAISAARELKLVLQEEASYDLTLGGHSWVIKRKDLESKVFLPYIQRVNRLVNLLLSQKGLSAQAVKQVVCTGGSASLGAIARWLRQKFPNATIIQDTYAGEYSNSCSRVAYGLANLCHYPNVLDAHRHQYSDYFLMMELLRILPDQPLPAGGILHLLEQRGINTKACQAHVLALIEGHLPPGLVPTEGDRPLISAQTSNIEIYQALSELPLFRKQGGQIYIADRQQGDRLRTHLESVLSTKIQKLQEPLTATQLTPKQLSQVG